MENKRWFQEKLDEIEELENYISSIFTEWLEEMGYVPAHYTFLGWENLDDEYITITASYWNDYEDDVFRLSKEYFYEGNQERRRNMMSDEYVRLQNKKIEEEKRKEQERMERKRNQLKKLKEELGDE